MAIEKNINNLDRGFSLIELMVAVAIIGMLATVAAPNFSRFVDQAKIRGTEAQLSAVKTVIEGLNAANGRYPDTTTPGVLWLSSTGTAYGATCNPMLDAGNPQNNQSLVDLCTALPTLYEYPRSMSCAAPPNMGIIYFSDGNNYKLLAHCYPNNYLSHIIDPNRPTWAFGFWTMPVALTF